MRRINEFRKAIEAGQGLTLSAKEAAELWAEFRYNDLPLIYADFQGNITWRSECERLQKELDALKTTKAEKRMTAHNYCPAGDECDHRTKAEKAAEHGTPDEFEAHVMRRGLLTPEDAADTIKRYRAEYDASPDSPEAGSDQQSGQAQE